MKNFSHRCFLVTTLVGIALLNFSACNLQSQVIVKTNSLVSYSYQSNNVFVPGDPLASASGNTSTFSFLPTDFRTNVTGLTWDIKSISGVVGLGMDANPGHHFDGPIVVDVNATANYTINAPLTNSSAGAAFSMPFTLYITEVDNAAFASPLLQYATNIPITPPYIATNGPVFSLTGQMAGSLSLDINTVKLYFGIASTNNITGMRLQVSPSLAVWGEKASVDASVVNFNVTNKVVPEPSACALLLLGSGAMGVAFWRRRRP